MVPGTSIDSPLASVLIGTCRLREAAPRTASELTMPSSVAMSGGEPLPAAAAAGSTTTVAWDS